MLAAGGDGVALLVEVECAPRRSQRHDDVFHCVGHVEHCLVEEVLELARGRAGVTIELKHYGHAQRLEERVAEIVEAATGENTIFATNTSSIASPARLESLRSISMPALAMIWGMDPRVAIPMSPQAVQSIAIPVVSGRTALMPSALLHNRSLAAL